jgi:YhcH/YjgK/YiaL family protein
MDIDFCSSWSFFLFAETNVCITFVSLTIKIADMIIDKLENQALYAVLGDGIKKGFDFLLNNDLTNLEVGKYEIDGKKIFASVMEYTSKEPHNAKLEAHMKFIDLQYVISGEELMGYTPRTGQVATEDKLEEKDVIFYNEPADFVKVSQGMFAIFFPTDLHQPSVKVSVPSPVKKVVVKIAVDY